MGKENRDVGAEMIMANDVTEIRLIKAEYHWEMGYNEFDFACRITGQENNLYLREQRHDDGTGFVIHSEKGDIWKRITRTEACKLEEKLQEAIQYGNYHKKIGELTSLDDCKEMEFELMENDNIYLNRVIKRLWTELASKQEELECGNTNTISKFRAKTDDLFHPIENMSPAEIEGLVTDYVRHKITEYDLDVELIDVVVAGSRCRGLEKPGSDLDVVVEYKGPIQEDSFFDILHEDEMEIGGVKVDINPITDGKTGTLNTYLPQVEDYLGKRLIDGERKKSVKNILKKKKNMVQESSQLKGENNRAEIR